LEVCHLILPDEEVVAKQLSVPGQDPYRWKEGDEVSVHGEQQSALKTMRDDERTHQKRRAPAKFALASNANRRACLRDGIRLLLKPVAFGKSTTSTARLLWLHVQPALAEKLGGAHEEPREEKAALSACIN
jgi:hypothetical protein